MPRSLVVDVVNIVERRAAPANHQGVRFSVATNGKFTVATNIAGAGHRGGARRLDKGDRWQDRDGSIGGVSSITSRTAGGDGREYRESARSAHVAAAERLLATRLAERQGHARSRSLTFDALAAWYLDDYAVRRLRTLNTARGRVANLRAVFTGWQATAITSEAVRTYQRTRRAAGAAAATVNRETSALSRMLQLAVRGGQLAQRPVFPERLEENGPRQGFFEHAEYLAVRQHLPRPYQDVFDVAGGVARGVSAGGGCRGGCCTIVAAPPPAIWSGPGFPNGS